MIMAPVVLEAYHLIASFVNCIMVQNSVLGLSIIHVWVDGLYISAYDMILMEYLIAGLR
jgi:hypothetical protein